VYAICVASSWKRMSICEVQSTVGLVSAGRDELEFWRIRRVLFESRPVDAVSQNAVFVYSARIPKLKNTVYHIQKHRTSPSDVSASSRLIRL